MPQPVDLSFAFGLEPRAAVEYFRAKGYALTFNWDAMAAEAHARAFTVAKVMRMDVLTSIREELDRALAEGPRSSSSARTSSRVFARSGGGAARSSSVRTAPRR
jgi:uncharacterized protein with gpF-like domain